MNDEPAIKAPATRITFDLRQIFPSDDSLSVPLLRLMSATDDARYVQKLALLLLAKTESANQLEAPILNGELLYVFRLLCGHLYEAGIAFRDLEQARRGLLNDVMKDDGKGKTYLAKIREAYATEPEGAFHSSFLHPIRNLIGFHYKAEPLKAALRRHNQAGDLQGTIVLVEHYGLGRYTVCDHLATGIIQDVVGGNFQEFREAFADKMGEVIALAGALSQVVDRVLVHLFSQHEAAILEEKKGEVHVPREIARH